MSNLKKCEEVTRLAFVSVLYQQFATRTSEKYIVPVNKMNSYMDLKAVPLQV
jgi:3-oxoacyl-ACP reductase-like protein